jgi:hypothetical protein
MTFLPNELFKLVFGNTLVEINVDYHYLYYSNINI